MGLENHLIDYASDSIPMFLLIRIVHCVCYLRSVVRSLLAKIGLPSAKINEPSSFQFDSALCENLGSGLAEIVMQAEQLDLNRHLSYRFNQHGSGLDCVVCMNRLDEGEQVRKLECSHVFHKQCFDGWLHQLNFNCPLCRSPLVAEEIVVNTRRRIGQDLCAWFSFR